MVQQGQAAASSDPPWRKSDAKKKFGSYQHGVNLERRAYEMRYTSHTDRYDKEEAYREAMRAKEVPRVYLVGHPGEPKLDSALLDIFDIPGTDRKWVAKTPPSLASGSGDVHMLGELD